MPSRDWTIGGLLAWAADYFQQRGIDSPRTTADLLLAHALGVARIDLYLRHDQPLNADELAQFKGLIRRRLAREPVAYITGVKEFWSLELTVTPDVLIPRPETECLVEAALAAAAAMDCEQPLRILDLGTGSGAIAIALAKQLPGSRVVASEISPGAVAVARENVKRHNLKNQVRILTADWLSPFDASRRPFDLIVSNPPYISSNAFEDLQPEVRDYEPRRALDGRLGGLECLERIVSDAYRYLTAGGYLLLEMGHDQRERLHRMVRQTARYADIVFFKDYSGHDRVARMRIADA